MSTGRGVTDKEEGSARMPPTNKASGSFGWEAASVAISRLFQKSSYFITSLILSRLLGPEGRGLVIALLVPAHAAGADRQHRIGALADRDRGGDGRGNRVERELRRGNGNIHSLL